MKNLIKKDRIREEMETQLSLDRKENTLKEKKEAFLKSIIGKNSKLSKNENT